MIYKDLHQLFITNQTENSTLNNSRSPGNYNYTFIFHLCMHKRLINFLHARNWRVFYVRQFISISLLYTWNGAFEVKWFLLSSLWNREVTSIIMAATITPPPKKLQENITLKFKNIKVARLTLFFPADFVIPCHFWLRLSDSISCLKWNSPFFSMNVLFMNSNFARFRFMVQIVFHCIIYYCFIILEFK